MKNQLYRHTMEIDGFQIDFYGYKNAIVAKCGDSVVGFYDGLMIENDDEFIAEVRYLSYDHVLQDMGRIGMFSD
jgi:hypothetical protein